jgi:hypothetical protein
MANLADDELMTLLRAAQRGFEISDGVITEHVGDLLSYDKQIVPRLNALLAAKRIPTKLEFIASELARVISQDE